MEARNLGKKEKGSNQSNNASMLSMSRKSRMTYVSDEDEMVLSGLYARLDEMDATVAHALTRKILRSQGFSVRQQAQATKSAKR